LLFEEIEMNAIEYLENQHREVEALFKKMDSLKDKSGHGKELKAIFSQIVMNLEGHMKIEEKIFYPEGRQVDDDTTLEAIEEHEAAKALIKKILKTRTNDETYMAKVTVLKEMIEHHVKEEENEYFPECRKAWSAEKLEELGEEMEALFERAKNGGGRRAKPQLRLAKAS